MKFILIIIVCLLTIFLLKNLVFSEKHNVVVEHYDITKKEYVFYKNVTKRNDILSIRRIIHNTDWEKYYLTKDDYVICQFYFDNRNDKVIMYQILENYSGLILVRKDTNQKSCLSNRDLELIINILQ